LQDADVADVAAGRDRIACLIDSWVPTASITKCAPSPSVRSFELTTPSSLSSSAMLVAPNRSARFCRARGG